MGKAAARATTIVPGKAIQLSIEWQQQEELQLLCIYAPSSSDAERKHFFEKVRTCYIANSSTPKPHIMAGDFNNVEDAIDRLPVGIQGPVQLGAGVVCRPRAVDICVEIDIVGSSVCRAD